MASVALQKQIDCFERLLPQLRSEHGIVWALVARETLQGAFASFHEAASYASSHLGGEQVLIRNTGGHPVSLPFVMVEGG